MDGERRPPVPRARRVWWVAVAATVLTVAIAAAIFLVTAPQRTSEDEVPARAQVWVTSTAEERLEATQSVGASSSAPPGAETGPADDTLTIDLDATGQQDTSFGAALTHSSASLLAAIDDAHRRALLLELFDPSGPVRLSVLRVPFGG